jgi:outer membrane protein TolC
MRIRGIALIMFFVLLATGRAHAEGLLTLSRALKLGHERAFPLKGARDQAASADANVDEQRAAYYPTLSAALTGGANATRDTQVKPPPETGLFVFVNSSGSASGSASLRWTLYDFGRTAGAVSAAREGQRAAVAGVASAELSVMSDVANAYVALYYRERLRDVARATLTEREDRVALARGLIKNGLMPPLEEIRTTARADAARVAFTTAEADVADARAALASLLALDPDSLAEVAPPRLPEPDLDAVSAARVADRVPSVRAAEASALAKEASADSHAARYFPTLSLNADGVYRFARYDKDSEFTNTRSATGSLVLSVPILDLSIAPDVRGARADAAVATETARETRRTARDEATRAALAVRATLSAFEQARAAAEKASAVLTIVEARYKDGLSSPLELIDAEGADSDARVTVAQTELGHALALVRAAVATGRPIVEAP